MSKIEMPKMEDLKALTTAEEFSVNGDGVVNVDKGLGKKWLAACGLTEDDVRRAEMFQSLVAATGGDLLREHGLPVMKAKAEVTRIVAKIPTVGHSNVQIVLDREKQSRSPRTGEVSTTRGVLSAKVVTASVKSSSGAFMQIRKKTMEEAEALLG